ncbi:hypothetical protein [Actinoallomurus acanthiterrae]
MKVVSSFTPASRSFVPEKTCDMISVSLVAQTEVFIERGYGTA